ncbi:MAG: alpha-galactosidase [Clostridia bacterium]|nr:alpha-galactosidase [Clostridia bacterium]
MSKKTFTSVLTCLGGGELSFAPYIVMADGEELFLDYNSEICDEKGTAVLSAELAGVFRDDLYFTYKGDEITCRRVFENISDKDLNIKEIAVKLSGISFGNNLRDDYFYHNENPRIFEAMTFPIDYDRTSADSKDSEFDIQAGNRWADPGVICERIGASPYQPFPAILLSNYKTKAGLVHGSLSQKTFFHNYLAKHENNAVTLDIFSSFKATAFLKAEPGRILTDEWYLGKTDDADNIEKIFEKYANELRKKLPVGYGRTSINRDNMVWGTWNDGVFRDVCEELILREAKYLKDNFPTVRWIQLDDGYAVYNKVAHGLGVVYEGEEGIDKTKFPNGLRHMTDEIRKIGLRPALWIGGLCPPETKIFKEKPEWFIDYTHRTPNRPLDVSQPKVKDYMRRAVGVLCEKYGFEAVKHDFWSYAFEDSHDLYKNKDKSGYENRTWWLKEIRDVLPKDGYLQTGCDIVMGNPFLGEYFTNYRYGIDIGSGNWDYVKTNYLWGAACFATHTGDLFVPNSDSVGLLPGLNETEAMFCINYCLVTHSMVEIAGLLSLANNPERLKILKKAVCNPNNGQDIYFVGYDYRLPYYCVPNIIYFKTPHFSKAENSDIMPVRTVGIFNVDEETKSYGFTAEDLGLAKGEYVLTDVWSGKQYELDEEFKTEIEAHGSRMLAVSKKEGIQLYDANIRINDAKVENAVMFLETDYAVKDAELSFNKEVKSIYVCGNKVNFKQEKNTVFFDVTEAGTIKVEF